MRIASTLVALLIFCLIPDSARAGYLEFSGPSGGSVESSYASTALGGGETINDLTAVNTQISPGGAIAVQSGSLSFSFSNLVAPNGDGGYIYDGGEISITGNLGGTQQILLTGTFTYGSDIATNLSGTGSSAVYSFQLAGGADFSGSINPTLAAEFGLPAIGTGIFYLSYVQTDPAYNTRGTVTSFAVDFGTIPEPSSVVLAASGIGLVCLSRLRRAGLTKGRNPAI